MSDGREYQPPSDTSSLQRVMMRCTACKVTQTVLPETAVPCGACGGELEVFNWEKHFQSLPRKPYDRANDKK